jgi:hypothetical protein
MLVAVNNGRVCLYGEIFAPVDLPEALKMIEAAIIERTIEACGGNKSMAAKILKLKRSTVVMKRRVYNRQGWISKQWAKEILPAQKEIPHVVQSTD